MKNNAITMILALGAACCAGSALNAQSSNNVLLAKVPFAFQVNGENFAAGKYVVREQGYLGIPSIQNAATGRTIFVAGAFHGLPVVSQPKLVFHCYAGSTCFLAEIRPTTGSGSTIAMSKAEKEVASSDQRREMATIAVDLRNSD
jgi:hypothetical protein